MSFGWRPAHAVLTVLVGLASATDATAAGGGVLRVTLAALPDQPGPQVTVAIATESDPWRRWTASLDDAPEAIFDELPPATYDLTLLVGGTAAARASVLLGPGEVVSVRGSPDGAGGFRLEVVDRHLAGEGTAFDARLLRDLPSSRDVWALVETAAPFVIADRVDTGGSSASRSPLVGSRGASWTGTTVSLGDIAVRDPGRTGLLDLAPDAAALDGVVVWSGLAPVEVDTPGVWISLVPRRPARAAMGEAHASLTTPGMVATNELSDAPSIARLHGWREAGVVASGPMGDDAGVLATVSASRAEYRERGRPALLDSGATSFFAHAVVRPGIRDQLRILAAAARLGYPFEDRRQLADRDGASERARLGQVNVTWERLTADGGSWVASAGVRLASRTPDIPDMTGGSLDRVNEGLVPPPPAALDRAGWDLRLRWEGRDGRWRGTWQSLRAGATLGRTRASATSLGLPTVAETVGGLPARVWIPHLSSTTSERTVRRLSMFVADRMSLASQLTLDAGARLDHVAGEAAGAAQGIDWLTVSPRLSARWVRAPFAVFGGVGRYAASHALRLVAHGDPGEAWYDVHRWDDDGDGVFAADEAGVLVERAGWGEPVASIDPDLRAPRTWEAMIGGEYRHGPHLLSGAIIVRRESNLSASVNVGVPFSAYRVVLVPDPSTNFDGPEDDDLLPVYDRLPATFGQDAFVLTTHDDDRVTYGGIEVKWSFVSARWSMLFGAMAYRTSAFGASPGYGPLENDQHVLGELYHSPNATPDEPGSLFFDRSYVGKWASSFHATDSLRFSFAARYQDGQPFSRVAVVPDLSTGPEMVQAYRVGRTRFTYTATLDVRVEKLFRLGGRQAGVRLDVFNLTNHGNEMDEHVLTDPEFRRSLSVQPPLTLRLGFRIGF